MQGYHWDCNSTKNTKDSSNAKVENKVWATKIEKAQEVKNDGGWKSERFVWMEVSVRNTWMNFLKLSELRILLDSYISSIFM